MAKKPAPPQIGVLSFFSGCGILDLGFEAAGMRVWSANEVNPWFTRAYEYSRTEMKLPVPARGFFRCGIEAFFDGGHMSGGHLPFTMAEARADGAPVGFVGGPPCPDFSVAGKQAGRHGDNGRLTQDYFDLIGIWRPDFFLFENVRGLYSTKRHRAFFDEVKRQIHADGYATSDAVLNAIEFGVPQDRWRVFMVGFHRAAFPDADRMAAEFPWCAGATHPGALGWAGWPKQDAVARAGDGTPTGEERAAPGGLTGAMRELTVQHWFERNGVKGHPNAADVFAVKSGLERMRSVPEGDVSRKSFKRLHRWRYSPTACYGNNEVHLHPWLDRRLSAAEAMAMQSLPAGFVLPPEMTLSDKFKTIGNGVPFLLSRALAATLGRVLAAAGRPLPVGRDPARGRTAAPEPDLVDPRAETAAPDGGSQVAACRDAA
jgi:DNA (cytosine-5)-methyltransferase 1